MKYKIGLKMENYSKATVTSLPSQDTLLQEANRTKLIEYIPLIVVLFIMAVIGLIGNVLTILFYGFKMKQTPTFVLIKLLAITDLIVCFLIFTTIADLCVNINFTSVVLCKLMYFLDHWFMLSSVLILWIISIHRYRKMCKPLGRQLTGKTATISVLLASAFSMVYCTHAFITYNPVRVNITTSGASTPTVIGHYCTNTDDEVYKVVVITFHVIDVVSVTLIFITFIFTYGNIWLTVRQHNKSAAFLKPEPKQDRTPKVKLGSVITKETSSTEHSTSQFTLDSTTDSVSKQQISSCQSSSTVERTTSPTGARKTKPSSKSSSANSRERNITLMMFVVTVGLVICFTPYFIGSVGIRAMSDTTWSEMNTGMELALRFPFFNSVINPIIFCVFNSQYRMYVKEKLFGCSHN